MADCLHDWQPRANRIKEACSKCGAARAIDQDRCNHEWVLRPSGTKYDCTKCGAAKVILEVKDMKNQQEAESPL